MLLRSFITRPSRVQFAQRPSPTLKFFALSSFATSSSGLTEYQKLQMAVKDKVESAIAKHNVVVFSKSHCPFCTRTKNTLRELVPAEKQDDNVLIWELDNMSDGAEIQSYLLEKTGQRTVPNVFIAQKHVGGNDDFQGKVRSKQVVVKDGLLDVIVPAL